MRIHSWDIPLASVAQMDFTLTLSATDLLEVMGLASPTSFASGTANAGQTINELGAIACVNDKWDEKEVEKGHKVVDYAGRIGGAQLFFEVTTLTRPGTADTFLLPHLGHFAFAVSCSDIVSVRSTSSRTSHSDMSRSAWPQLRKAA
jgi:hypothetical protein